MRAVAFKRRIGTVFTSALLALAGSVAASPLPAQAGGLDVFVGYADDSRTGAPNFPTPWAGAPNTVFIGTGSPWDAGAVRLVNSSVAPVLVDNVTVDLHHGAGGASGPVFSLWGSFTIPGNGQAILTQTAFFNFDTSDFPFQPCGTPAPASDPRIPTVAVTVGGATHTQSDTGHVLDTFGYDSACIGNESIQWSQIGTAACVGSSLSLAPPSQSAMVGSTATVTATFTNSCGAPLSGAIVNFAVTSGPNSGLTGSAVTDAGGNASFTYSSVQEGTDTLQASVTNPAGTILSNTVNVIWSDALIAAKGTPISAIEGTPFSGKVATFTDPDPRSTASEYSATIDWGDGSSSPGTITQTGSSASGNSFEVDGAHTYAEEGSDKAAVTITDRDHAANTAKVSSDAKVADADLSSSCATVGVTAGTYAGPTATFTDASTTGTLSDFSALINWGDGTTTAGVITGAGGTAPYTVSGTHTYSSTGFFVVTTTVTDVGGSTTSVSCSALIAVFAPGGGSFAIGDLESATGKNITFWGAQWGKDNPTSRPSKGSSFKGFAESPSTPACGNTWAADPGNSTPPPPGPLPTFMAVIVTSSYSKAGPSISGDVAHIVIVKTDPGYQPNPGHAGTGTVVAQLC